MSQANALATELQGCAGGVRGARPAPLPGTAHFGLKIVTYGRQSIATALEEQREESRCLEEQMAAAREELETKVAEAKMASMEAGSVSQ